MKKIILLLVVSLLMVGGVSANGGGTVKIAQIIHSLPSNYEVDDVALFNWLADYDTDVTQIVIHDMEGKNTEYWEQFNLIILPYGYSVPSIANLLASEVPIISVEEGFADELELGTGAGTFKASTRDFYVRDNTHPITSGLSSGAWTWSGTGFMWTQATDNAGYEGTATVLVDNGEVGKDILIVHKTKNYAFFGWYRASQWPDEGWSLMEKTIEWAIGRSLPPFSMEFTVEITDPDTIYESGDTINIEVDAGNAGYTVTGDFSNLCYTPKMAGIAYLPDNWWGGSEDTYYWLDTYLGSLGYTVEGIPQGTVEGYTSAQWEAYDVVFIFSNNFQSPQTDLTNLINSNVPIIMTGNDAGYAPQAGLGDGTYDKDNKQTFYVTDNTHPITQGLSLGEWIFDSSMWTTRIGTSGCDVTVLIDDNNSPAKAYLATRQDPNRVWFGYYRGTQAGAEAKDIFKNSIAWTLGKDSLPNIKADATDNGDGTYSISYTICDAPLYGTFTILITTEDQAGHTATDDSLSVTILPPCTDDDGDGYAIEGGDCGPIDCDDENPEINPGATELCDGKDNDCDGEIDEGCLVCKSAKEEQLGILKDEYNAMPDKVPDSKGKLKKNKDKNDLKKAIEHLEKSLDESKELKWKDDCELYCHKEKDPKADGKKVFDEAQKAIKDLMKIREPTQAILDVIVAITDVDKLLAEKAIEANPDCKADKVAREMTKAEEEYAKGKYDKAISHYRKAWQHATHCVCHPGKESCISEITLSVDGDCPTTFYRADGDILHPETDYTITCNGIDYEGTFHTSCSRCIQVGDTDGDLTIENIVEDGTLAAKCAK